MENSIHDRRKALGFSQQELAKRCGVSRQTINAIENNKYDPTLALAFALAAGLLGYGVQALVNIAQAPGISLFFVLLAVLRGQNDAEELTCG